MQKLILKCDLSPGDLVMMTAAVRDLHQWYPGRFLTDVRTRCPDLWDNNPHITPISDKDPEAQPIECSYPLIDRCNETPYHCLHGFIEFLNDRLRLNIKPTAFQGDIHLSAQEKAWFSQVREVTRGEIPFWIVAAGGKHDITIKWWESSRYQKVVDLLQGRVQFVQVGQAGDHHPKLEGAIDLRGKTSLRELIRLIYHSQGVLSSVTAVMHLAASVETKGHSAGLRPCVVIAGGREPAHWEAYPGHQFISNVGALPCCSRAGCWKERTVRLRDGDERDRPLLRCQNLINGIPRCLDMITPEHVVERIETYFHGGVCRYLNEQEKAGAQRGVRATEKNGFEQACLNLHSAGSACDEFIQAMPPEPRHYEGRGIVICGGGLKYFTGAWVCINMLRRLGCRLPVELWYMGRKEMSATMQNLLSPFGVECVDALEESRRFPVRRLGGWELKPYAILHSSFREVLFLDADNVPVINPEFLFDCQEYANTGAVFWPDYERVGQKKAMPIWRSCGLRPPKEQEFESGQILVDKGRCWRALRLSLWFNEHSDFYYEHLHGDKETFHLAFRKLKQPYALVQHPIHPLPATMCQHDFQGRRVFQHRNNDKWDFMLCNRRIQDFWFEDECLAYVRQLRRKWSGQVRPYRAANLGNHGRSERPAESPHITAVLFGSSDRPGTHRRTLANLSQTDWEGTPIIIMAEWGNEVDPLHGEARTGLQALETSLNGDGDYFLLLNGKLDFNRHIARNLRRWVLLRKGVRVVASLHNPGVPELACDIRRRARLADPEGFVGSRAFLISRAAAEYAVKRWNRVEGSYQSKLVQLGLGPGKPIPYHAPSLVTVLEGDRTEDCPSVDFSPNWKG